MDLIQMEITQLCAESENKQNENRKRFHQPCKDDHNTVEKRLKLEEQKPAQNECRKDQVTPVKIENTQNTNTEDAQVPQSPKKRLQWGKEQKKQPAKNRFIYGNYSQYYGYRNKDKNYHDIRLDVFENRRELFCDKELLDIGCNSGFITTEVAKRFPLKSATGIDIDKGLIQQANKTLLREKQKLSTKLNNNEQSENSRSTYPHNIRFMHSNYVLRDDVLLEIESEQFDVILCLSITKWIHLNFGDAGLKQALRRMFLQLRSGGKLILEAQPFDNYGRRKKMTDTIFANFKAMQFFPKQFTEYLLSAEVGFKTVELMGVPEHCAAGFKRPIQVFSKE